MARDRVELAPAQEVALQRLEGVRITGVVQDEIRDFDDVIGRAIKAVADRAALQAELRETRRVLAAVLEQQGGWVMVPTDRLLNIPLVPLIEETETDARTGYVFRFVR